MDRLHDRLFQEVKDSPISLELADGTTFEWEVASLPRLLSCMVSRSPTYSEALGATFARSPSTPATPYELVFYCDETVPGNILRPQSDRKCMAVYCVFRNFGPWVVNSSLWLPWAVLRANVIKQVAGGWATAACQLLRRCLGSAGGLTSEGMLLNLDIGGIRQPVFLHVRLSNVLGDLLGLAAFWSWKGPNATMPCLLCANLVHEVETAEQDDTGWLVALPESNPRRFVLSSSEDLWVKADALKELNRRLNRTDFKAAEVACGLNFNANSVLWAPDRAGDLANQGPRPTEIRPCECHQGMCIPLATMRIPCATMHLS